MGASNTITVCPAALPSYKLATVKKSLEPKAPLYNLYMSSGSLETWEEPSKQHNEIFTLPLDVQVPEEKEAVLRADVKIPLGNFIGVSYIHLICDFTFLMGLHQH